MFPLTLQGLDSAIAKLRCTSQLPPRTDLRNECEPLSKVDQILAQTGAER